MIPRTQRLRYAAANLLGCEPADVPKEWCGAERKSKPDMHQRKRVITALLMQTPSTVNDVYKFLLYTQDIEKVDVAATLRAMINSGDIVKVGDKYKVKI